MDIRLILGKFNLPLYGADEKDLAELWVRFYNQSQAVRQHLLSIDVWGLVQSFDEMVADAFETIKNTLISNLEERGDDSSVQYFIDISNILFSIYNSRYSLDREALKKDVRLYAVLEKILDKIKKIIKNTSSIGILGDYFPAITAIEWIDYRQVNEIRDLIVDRIETILDRASSLTELLDICGDVDSLSTDTDNLLLERVSKLIKGIEERAHLHSLIDISETLKRWLDDNRLEEYIFQLIKDADNYIDLVQEHGYLPSGEWRDRIETRLAELNRSSLDRKEINYRLSITPLGCEAREILQRHVNNLSSRSNWWSLVG